MWKRRLGFGFLLLFFSWQQPMAQSSPWEVMDSPTLLGEAASKIKELINLSEELKKEVKKSKEDSKALRMELESLQRERENILRNAEDLQSELENLKTKSAESERLRIELVDALRISGKSWKSYREEVEARIRKERIKGMMLGVGMGIVVGIVVGIGVR